jgi:hypothetical protein
MADGIAIERSASPPLVKELERVVTDACSLLVGRVNSYQ